MATSKQGSRKKSSSKEVQVQTTTLPVPVNPYADLIDVKASQTFQTFGDHYGGAEEWMDPQGMEELLLKFGYSTTWVYIAVRRIADATSQIPLYLVEPGAPGKRPSRVTGYDFGLQELVAQPNPWQKWSDFCQSLMVSMELTGNCFIELARPAGSKLTDRPTEMYVLNPSRITIVPDKKKYIKGYVYEQNGERFTLRPEQVIHLKYTHPMNEFYGFSPLTAARMAVDVDRSASEWNQNFLLNGAWPAGALESDNDMEEDDKKRLQRQIKRVLATGKDSSGKLLLLTGGLKYNSIAIKPKETDWMDTRRMSRDEILSIFGVPFAIAGLFSTEQTTARSAGVEQQIKQFYRTTIFPKVDLILSALNRNLAPLFRQSSQFVADYRSVPALQEEVDQEKTRAEALVLMTKAGVPLNAALERLYPEMEPVPWGDIAWMDKNLMPVEAPEIPAQIMELNKPKPPAIQSPTGKKPKPDPDAPAKSLQKIAAIARLQARVATLPRK